MVRLPGMKVEVRIHYLLSHFNSTLVVIFYNANGQYMERIIRNLKGIANLV